MKVSRRRIKFGKFVSRPARSREPLPRLCQRARASGGRGLGLSKLLRCPPVRVSMKSLAWPMSPTEPVPGYHARAVHDRLSMTQTTTNASSKLSAGRSRSTLVVGLVGRGNVFFIAIAPAPSWN
jgi:hypothetical protein